METQELLKAIIGRLEELTAEVKGLQAEVREHRADSNERLEQIEGRLDWMTEKWVEHDTANHKIRRRQA